VVLHAPVDPQACGLDGHGVPLPLAAVVTVKVILPLLQALHVPTQLTASIELHCELLVPPLRPSQIHVEVVPLSFKLAGVPAEHCPSEEPHTPMIGEQVPPVGELQVPAKQ